MSLYDQIQNDMYSSMKSGNKEEANALRTTLAKLKDKAIEKREDLTKEEEIDVGSGCDFLGRKYLEHL